MEYILRNAFKDSNSCVRINDDSGCRLSPEVRIE